MAKSKQDYVNEGSTDAMQNRTKKFDSPDSWQAQCYLSGWNAWQDEHPPGAGEGHSDLEVEPNPMPLLHCDRCGATLGQDQIGLCDACQEPQTLQQVTDAVMARIPQAAQAHITALETIVMTSSDAARIERLMAKRARLLDKWMRRAKDVRVVYCISLEGEGATGSEWRSTREARDALLGTLGATEEICFELQVPIDTRPDRITKLVDDAAWDKTYA